MESREDIIARVNAEYAQHRAEWEVLNPAPPRYSGEFYRPSSRISIERQPARVVYRSIHPYVGITSLRGRLLK